jgi:hypothetical protein
MVGNKTLGSFRRFRFVVFLAAGLQSTYSPTVQPEFRFDAFLSHSEKDKPVVRPIAERLRKDGLSVWFDEWEIKPGDSIPAKIEDGLEHSRVLVLCMSANAFGSDWALLEAGTFRFRDPLNKHRRLIPVRLDDAPIKGSLAQFLYINQRLTDREQEYPTLLNAVRSPECWPLAPFPGACHVTDRSNSTTMTTPPPNAVQPLHIAEDRFLQILLSKFTLTRHNGMQGPSIELSIHFDDDTPAIWDQEGKRFLRSILSLDKRKRFQRALDEFIIERHGVGPFKVEDPDFFFRYASGGTLPLIEFDEASGTKRYYCFFYRDVHPIGWNIANGGTDTRPELLNPLETIKRELREELIIADFEKGERYVFPSDQEKSIDHPAHAAARRLWKRKFPNRDLNALAVTTVQVEWKPGPDSLVVTMGSEEAIRRDGFYLNINGEDFGIEFDRIAVIRLPRRVTLFDGEIDSGRLVNSPVGLFDVERFNTRLRLGETTYIPDFFYFGDRRHDDGSELAQILKSEFIEHLRPIRTETERHELLHAINSNQHCHLCPVTQNITKRYSLHERITQI